MRIPTPDSVVWVDFGEGVGREQQGRRPAVVVSTGVHLNMATELVTVVPCTGRDREWANHVPVECDGLGDRKTFAMTEQVRTISRDRVLAGIGQVSEDCSSQIREWVDGFLDPNADILGG